MIVYFFSSVNSGILVPGGFGIRGTEGKILAANWARTKNVPYLGRVNFFLTYVYCNLHIKLAGT